MTPRNLKSGAASPSLSLGSDMNRSLVESRNWNCESGRRNSEIGIRKMKHSALCIARSIINSFLREDAFLIGMFDFAHFGDEVGAVNQFLRRVASGQHQRQVLRFCLHELQNVVQ